MKKVFLIGDSIRLGYQEAVAKRVADQAEVNGPNDNCRFSAYTLFCLHQWLGDEHYDIIQWNNGQWDTCHMLDGAIHTPLEEYVKLQLRIAGILQKRCERLIFATTTPVKGDMFAGNNPHPRRNEDITAYNAAAIEALAPRGVEINDLYKAVFARLDDCICDDQVHLTQTGIEVCANQVASLI